MKTESLATHLALDTSKFTNYDALRDETRCEPSRLLTGSAGRELPTRPNPRTSARSTWCEVERARTPRATAEAAKMEKARTRTVKVKMLEKAENKGTRARRCCRTTGGCRLSQEETRGKGNMQRWQPWRNLDGTAPISRVVTQHTANAPTPLAPTEPHHVAAVLALLPLQQQIPWENPSSTSTASTFFKLQVVQRNSQTPDEVWAGILEHGEEQSDSSTHDCRKRCGFFSTLVQISCCPQNFASEVPMGRAADSHQVRISNPRRSHVGRHSHSQFRRRRSAPSPPAST